MTENARIQLESKQETITTPCPRCGYECEQHPWTRVNAMLNPELVPQIVDGTLFDATCPRCGFVGPLELSFIYLDTAHNACVCLTDKDTFQQIKDSMPQAFSETGPMRKQFSMLRVVFALSSLRELVLAISHGLDDRTIELVKRDLSAELMMNGSTLSNGLIRDMRLSSVEDSFLGFEVTYDKSVLIAKKSMNAYEANRSALLASTLADMQPLRADSLWASAAHTELIKEGLI